MLFMKLIAVYHGDLIKLTKRSVDNIQNFLMLKHVVHVVVSVI
jgi:hypothetical protein